MAEYIERAAFVGELTAAETQKELRNMTSADAYFAVCEWSTSSTKLT